MKITKVSEAPIKETPHKVDTRPVYDDETAQAVHIRLEPGETLKPHITPVDVFFYILEGTPNVHIGEEKEMVQVDWVIESPKDIVHYLSNTSDKPARILVVKAPKPTQQTKLL
ncbi:cupin domain-containing protein [Marinilabilia salmonicolor]|uniref:cupin domain-containing protein n=1 Tax=Marinilabilia salmonicolor TaxID=989 RepID=UPI00029AD410|nr:cupin domain-containing protein [Marinilabilia salmonicolor]